MKDHLQDIVAHTHSLGFIELVKITGTDTETKLEAVANDRSVILSAHFNGIVPEFIGTFGMPNLNKLNTILNIPEYKENPRVSIVTQTKDKKEIPVGVHFENASGDFKNDYRFMSDEVVNDKLKTIKFKGVNWDVDFVPTVVGIQRLKYQSQANSEENTFIAKTDGGNLLFYFGDHSSHAGNFVFQSGVAGNLTKAWSWPINAAIGILSLPGDKTLKISDQGAAMITVDSGLVEYNYILPAQQK